MPYYIIQKTINDQEILIKIFNKNNKLLKLINKNCDLLITSYCTAERLNDT